THNAFLLPSSRCFCIGQTHYVKDETGISDIVCYTPFGNLNTRNPMLRRESSLLWSFACPCKV
ncbi:MAG TPA: hypothetical protein VEJ88_03375, partial [Dissulfurispiraceae bacterium]|nr:hypothetical protein [Dissulfurispiraceae bacterium]